jgi:hypothetical protein
MKKFKQHAVRAAIAVTLVVNSAAHAALTAGEVLDGSLPTLVKDTYTGLQWLSPTATRNHAYNDSYVQGLTGLYGLRYATAQEANYLVESNFGWMTRTQQVQLNPASRQGAQNFFSTFGSTFTHSCSSSGGPICNWSLGWTSTGQNSFRLVETVK